MKMGLSGIFAPITTPFIDEELSINQLKKNMRVYRQTAQSGYFVLGSNGENKSLDKNEKLKVLEVIVQEKAKNQLVMAGGGYESTARTIAFCRKLANAGANLVSVLTPCYFKKAMTDEVLIGYYSDDHPFFVTVHLQPPISRFFISPQRVILRTKGKVYDWFLFSKLTALSSPRKKSTGTPVWRRTDRAMINTGPK